MKEQADARSVLRGAVLRGCHRAHLPPRTPLGRVCLCAKRKQLFIKKVLPKGLVQLRAIDVALLSDVQITQQIRWQT